MVMLAQEGQAVNRKRMVRLMRLMGLEVLFPRRSPARSRSCDLSVSVERGGSQWTGSSLVCRHHLHSHGLQVHVSGDRR